jgi:O-antigen/teichoic acid export membrane protein
MNSFSWSFASNISARVWVAACSIIFVPFYLKFLGVEGYALIGVLNLILSIVGVFDLGLGGALTHGMARLRAKPESLNEQRNLLRTLEMLFWPMSLGIAGIIFFGAGVIAERWLNAERLSLDELVRAMQLIGLTVAFQFVSGFYQGALVGVEKQVMANAIVAGSALVKGTGAVLLLWLFAPTPEVYFGWQAIVTGATVLVTQAIIWRSLEGAQNPKFNIECLRDIRGFAAGWSANALANAALNSADKLVLSRVLPLQMFGYYTLAQTLAISLGSLGGAVSSTAFPRLSRIVATRNDQQLAKFYHLACQLTAVTVIPVGCVVALYSTEILHAWTRSADVAANTSSLLTLMAAGAVLLSLSVVPNFVLIAHSSFRLTLIFTTALAVSSACFAFILASTAGVLGAAASWLMVSAASTFIVPAMHRRILPGELRGWFIHSALGPLIASILIVGGARLTIPPLSPNILGLVVLVPVWGASILGAVLMTRELRSRVFSAVWQR